jgi:tRNA pseudouridine55 synthase
VVCSSGTYIRALARDLGAGLGVGGHLTSLRRTRIGPFGIDAADPLDRLDVARALIGPADAASRLFDRLDLDEQQALELSQGKRIAAPDGAVDGGPVAAIDPHGRLIGLAEYRAGEAKSIVNFPPDDPPPSAAQPAEAAEAEETP